MYISERQVDISDSVKLPISKIRTIIKNFDKIKWATISVPSIKSQSDWNAQFCH